MSDPFLAQIIMIGANFAPRSWAFCDGQILPINTYQALYSLLGTTYGGDGRTTFGLPGLRGRVPFSVGQGPGVNNVTWGQKGGAETNTLQANNLPQHTHTATGRLHAIDTTGDQRTPSGNRIAQDPDNRFATSADGTMADDAASLTLANTGNSQAFSNIQPYIALNYIIALQGVFPSRN